MFTKNFARMVCREQLNDDEVELFFDIVSSVVATKIVTGYDENTDEVEIEVLSFE